MCFASCGDPSPRHGETSAASRPDSAGFGVPSAGCYLGGETRRGDSIMIRISDGFDGASIRGEMEVVIHEKDRRSGTWRGTFGADGVVRAAYTFLQEGATETIGIQFTRMGGENGLVLRPSAYDSVTGKEYPDSTRDFSTRLNGVPCEVIARGKFDRGTNGAVPSNGQRAER